VLGYVAEESPQKPRMPMVHWRKIGRSKALAWLANMAQHYGRFSRLIKFAAKKLSFTVEV
jgi:hypothetical protein